MVALSSDCAILVISPNDLPIVDNVTVISKEQWPGNQDMLSHCATY